MRLTKSRVAAARRKSPWGLSNQVLYDLCARYPLHEKREQVVAKVLLIGRTYAAAIERRREKVERNEAFYLKTVAPKIIRSKIDTWISDAQKTISGTADITSILLGTHYKVTKLFRQISKQDKRSLASKYLHFHAPDLFFIIDSRALRGMRAVKDIVGRPSPLDGEFDDEYRKFVQKCLSLRDHCKQKFGFKLSPRQLDNLLLRLSER